MARPKHMHEIVAGLLYEMRGDLQEQDVWLIFWVKDFIPHVELIRPRLGTAPRLVGWGSERAKNIGSRAYFEDRKAVITGGHIKLQEGKKAQKEQLLSMALWLLGLRRDRKSQLSEVKRRLDMNS